MSSRDLLKELEEGRAVKIVIEGDGAMNKKRLGSNFNDFLQEEILLEEAETAAVKRFTAFQIKHEMKRRKLATDVIAASRVTDGDSSATSDTKSAAN